MLDIKDFKEKNSIVGFKVSFEDEGASLEDIIIMKAISLRNGIPLYVKIGGCEAKTDIINCSRYMIDGVVSPMIESEFAIEKFINCCDELGFSGQRFINVETKTCVDNLQNIIDSPSSIKINGFTIGRSDLTASYGLTKKSVNSDMIFKIVKASFKKIKKLGFVTTMGGNLTSDSKDFIIRLYETGLLDKIETRNIIIKLTDQNIKRVETVIDDALYIETLILKDRRDRAKLVYDRNLSRLENISRRIR